MRLHNSFLKSFPARGLQSMISGLWALCMRQCCMQRNCWIGSVLSNFLPLTFQSNCENSLTALTMLAPKTIPRCVLSLFVICFSILKQLASSDYKHSGVEMCFVACFAQLSCHSVPCSSLLEHCMVQQNSIMLKEL